MNIEYACKFCHTHRTVDAEIHPAMITVEKWLPLLTCNRCADYLRAKRAHIDKIKDLCEMLVQIRQIGDTSDASSKIKNKLFTLTRKLANVVCKHFHRPVIWEAEFPELLFGHPDKWPTAVGMYVRGVQKA